MKVKYEARIFDRAKGHFWREFWKGDDVFFSFQRYRVELWKQYEKSDEFHEIDWEYCATRRGVKRKVNKMLDKQRFKNKDGRIGTIKMDVELS